MTDKDDLIKVMDEYHIISVEMTGSEIAFDQEQLLQALQRVEDLALERKAVMADIKARHEKLTETLEDLMKRLKSRRAMRSILCTLTLNYSTLTAELRNKATGELINSRPMSNQERNMDPTSKLPFEEEEPQPDPAPAPSADPEPPEPTEEEPTSAETADDGTLQEISEAANQAALDEVNAHATEKFGPDPQDAPDAVEDPPDTTTTSSSGSAGRNEDDDLALWLD